MMTLDECVGQMFAVGFEGLTAPQYILDWLTVGRVGGIILFARNVENPAQLAALTQSLHRAAKYPLLIGIDQEGGTVARLRQGFTESPGAMALASASRDAENHVQDVSRVLAIELRALGINWNYAPVVDISYNADNPSVGTRSFGANPSLVIRLATAAVRGFQSGGVAACAKHFPGLGNTAIDTHVALPTLDASVADLLTRDLMPYRAVIAFGIASIMTTHTIFRTLDANHPATLSPVVVPTLLRGTLNFQGVVTTDCMEMKAIANHYSPTESAVMAALASVDMILFSHTRTMQEAAYEGLFEAVKSGHVPQSMIEASNERTTELKQRFRFTGTDLSVIRSSNHLAVMYEAALHGLTLIQGTLPLSLSHDISASNRIVLIEFASVLESGIVESGGQTGLGQLVKEAAPSVKAIALRSEDDIDAALQAVGNGDLLILATRNAHLNEPQREKAAQLVAAASMLVHVCLRNPYDARLFPDADTILCSCGDAMPSLEAVVEALFGVYTPTGQLPVSLS